MNHCHGKKPQDQQEDKMREKNSYGEVKLLTQLLYMEGQAQVMLDGTNCYHSFRGLGAKYSTK